MIEQLLYNILLVLFGFVVADRLFSRYYTGSWWKQPSDIEPSDAEK